MLLSTTFLIKSQNISLKSFTNLKSKTNKEVVDFMTSKSWTVYDSKFQENSGLKYQNIVFAYDYKNETKTANSYAIFTFMPDNIKGQSVELQITEESIFQIFLDEIKQSRVYFLDYFIENNHSKTVLQNLEDTFIINYVNNIYYITILDTEMFNRVMK